MADIKKLAEELVGLTISEANELAKLLEEEYGIKPAAAAVAVAGPAGGDGAAFHSRQRGPAECRVISTAMSDYWSIPPPAEPNL